MKYPTCLADNLLVRIDKKYEDEITAPGGMKFYFDPSFDPTWHATVTGTVLTVPMGLSTSPDVKGIIPEAVPGDEIIFSYLVVSEMDDHYAYPVHANWMNFDGEECWKVNYGLVLGYIRNGEIVPASGYVFMEQFPDIVTEKTDSGLWIPEMSQRKKIKGRAIARHIGIPKKGKSPLDVRPGETVFYNDRFVQKYKIAGTNWLVLEQDRIDAKQVPGEKMSPDIYCLNEYGLTGST